jgi:integrase/recombinase XerD
MPAAIEGFLLFKSGVGLSARTLESYEYQLDRFSRWIGATELHQVNSGHISAFLDHLRTEYRTERGKPLSSQSVRNAWIALKAFFGWASKTLDIANPTIGIPGPKAHNVESLPFTQEEIRTLLAVIMPMRARRPKSGARYLQALRDRAVILLLLDTGVRAGELCALTIGDLHLKSGRLSVISGKGGRHRYVYIGSVTKTAIWHYLQERNDGGNPDMPLISNTGQAMSRSWLRKHLVKIGATVGVPKCNPHRFRYTFAIQYLRNGGDAFSLKAILGHSSTKMVNHYVKMASADIELIHRRASPVDNWLK